MSDSIKTLTERLSAKEVLLNELMLLMDEERACIVEMDSAGLESRRENKILLVERLAKAKASCREALEDSSQELGLSPDAALSTLIEALHPSRREGLAAARRRIVDLVEKLNRSNSFNRDLLHRSLIMVNRSIEFYNSRLGSSDTYSGSGRMVSGITGGKLVKGEI